MQRINEEYKEEIRKLMASGQERETELQEERKLISKLEYEVEDLKKQKGVLEEENGQWETTVSELEEAVKGKEEERVKERAQALPALALV